MSVSVELQGLSKAWGPRAALDGLSLSLPPGQITALLGPSGCGKTTALRIVAGLLQADGGCVLMDGEDISPLPPEKRSAVMVFQNGLLFPRMTVAENLSFGLRMRGAGSVEIGAAVAAMLTALQLGDRGGAMPDQLSGGQAQRVALGRALILRPKLLLLDEPLASLDPHLRGEMQALIGRLQRESGVTTLMVTHDQAEAVAMADQMALMFEGRLRQVGGVRDFLDRPADEQVARFFGGCNFVAGVVREGRFESPLGLLGLQAPAPDGPAQMTIRPEALRPGPGPNAVQARVMDRRDLGTGWRVQLRVGETELTALWPTAWAAKPGEAVTLHLPPESLAIIPPAR